MCKLNFNKKVLILSVISLILIFTAFLGIFFSGKNIQSRAVEKNLVSNFNIKKVVQIDIKDSVNSILLSKVDNSWKVDYDTQLEQANQEKVINFLNSVKNLKSGKKITKNSEKYGELGLTDQKNEISFTFENGEKVVIFSGNSPEDDYSKQYMLLDGNNQVYLTDIIHEFKSAKKDWINLKVFANIKDVATITSVSVKGKNPVSDDSIKQEDRDLNYTLIKTVKDGQSDLVWKKEGSDDLLDNNSVTSFNSLIYGLTAEDILLPSNKIENTAVVITVTTADGGKKTLFVDKNMDAQSRYICYVEEDRRSFFISKWDLKNLLKKF